MLQFNHNSQYMHVYATEIFLHDYFRLDNHMNCMNFWIQNIMSQKSTIG